MVRSENVPFESTEMLVGVVAFVRLRLNVVVPVIGSTVWKETSAPEYIACWPNVILVDDLSIIDPVVPA